MSISTARPGTIPAKHRPMTRDEKKIILASSLGTVFEWYDFYLYGSLAVVIGAKFFGQFDETTRNIFALLAFAAGFLVRPFGALVFGRIGDLVGRKYTFLVTIVIMGSSTFIVGILPTSRQHRHHRRDHPDRLANPAGSGAGRRVWRCGDLCRGACAGRAARLLYKLDSDHGDAGPVPVAAGHPVHPVIHERCDDFQAWGWRIPFLVSIILLGVSVWIRMQLSESPAFLRMKAEGTHSKAPLTEAFGQWANAKWAILALLGLVAGQAVVWYSGQFYALFFLTVDAEGGRLHRQPAGRLVAGARHRRLRPVRLAVRQDRPQADHPGWLPDRRADLFPGVQVHGRDRQPGAVEGA